MARYLFPFLTLHIYLIIFIFGQKEKGYMPLSKTSPYIFMLKVVSLLLMYKVRFYVIQMTNKFKEKVGLFVIILYKKRKRDSIQNPFFSKQILPNM